MLNSNGDVEFNDDQLFVFRQGIRYVAATLKNYFDSHACLQADKIRATLQLQSSGGSFLFGSSRSANKVGGLPV